MSRIHKTPKRACFNCGLPGQTKEHVPARGLFPDWIRRRAQLITVPSCRDCNVGSALDDEYFRTALTANIDASPAAMHVWVDDVRPALQRPQFQGLKNALRRSLRPISIATEEGVVETAVFSPDMRRLDRVARRIIKGVYYHHSGEPVPPSHEITITFRPDEDLKQQALATNVKLSIVDEHVFVYRWCILDEASIWWLLFYGATLVAGMTTPPDIET